MMLASAIGGIRRFYACSNGLGPWVPSVPPEVKWQGGQDAVVSQAEERPLDELPVGVKKPMLICAWPYARSSSKVSFAHQGLLSVLPETGKPAGTVHAAKRNGVVWERKLWTKIWTALSSSQLAEETASKKVDAQAPLPEGGDQFVGHPARITAQNKEEPPDELDEALDALNAMTWQDQPMAQKGHSGFGETLSRLQQLRPLPPMERIQKTNVAKIAAARQLTDWMEDTLNQHAVQVAVVARQGNAQVRRHDRTGMVHSGLVLKDAKTQRWVVYNLIHYQENKKPMCHILRTEPLDFFYEQAGTQPNGLLLVPYAGIQKSLLKLIQSGAYRQLHYTPHYNLVSSPGSETSLNCNKWVLLNLVAATSGQPEPKQLMQWIQEGFQPGVVQVNPVLRPILAKFNPKIRADEVPWWEPVHTVTVESLHRLGLFSHKLFYAEAEKATSSS